MTCDLEGSSNLVSTCNCGGVLAGSLVAEFVVLAVAMVTINIFVIIYLRKKRCDQTAMMFMLKYL